MPKDTFFHLDDEKRKKIMKAAKDEFTQNELHKSRVSNIIKKAGIPRGSFYQYFEDLTDLYYYVINDSFDSLEEMGKKYSEFTNDVFEYALLSFMYDYEGFVHDKRHQFMRNVVKSISSDKRYIKNFVNRRIDYIEYVLSHMDLANVRLKDHNDLIRMYQLIQDVKRNVIQKAIIENKSKEEAYDDFKWHLDILKYGLVKE
ncbi:MAG: TetR family transcriptional regulator [Candidatus Izemoplasmataceae bacterium]|uniref:TetR family transcriptional regulator n=1 Tax=Firmicutes bacterium enrichment culture clone fosmid MGS-M2 TaxID=1549349 RepID=A0A0B5KGY8_9FIRM|nr:TetR family transcriptional regulator [Firmicutes bacterium enrichment culture clone fosmid MGS-M2]